MHEIILIFLAASQVASQINENSPETRSILPQIQKHHSVSLHVFHSDGFNRSIDVKYSNEAMWEASESKSQSLSDLCGSRKPLLKFIIHGFAEEWNMSVRWDWVKDMREAMFNSLEGSRICFIAVDWRDLAKGDSAVANYWRAIDNMPICAELLTSGQLLSGIDPNRMHCIGFSLGAHMVSSCLQKSDMK